MILISKANFLSSTGKLDSQLNFVSCRNMISLSFSQW